VIGEATLPPRISWPIFSVDRLVLFDEEVGRFEEVGNAEERFVVHQHGAQQLPLRFDIVRRASGKSCGLVFDAADGGHGADVFLMTEESGTVSSHRADRARQW
jgi:hypothetical protein